MYLDILVLRATRKKGLSGVQITKYLEKKVGWKPSPGSIYPLLKKLSKKGFLDSKKKKNKKIYTLTDKGEEYMEELAETNITGHLEQQINIFREVSKNKITPKIIKELEKCEGIACFPPSLIELKMLLIQKLSDDKHCDKVEKILKKTIKDLKEI